MSLDCLGLGLVGLDPLDLMHLFALDLSLSNLTVNIVMRKGHSIVNKLKKDRILMPYINRCIQGKSRSFPHYGIRVIASRITLITYTALAIALQPFFVIRYFKHFFSLNAKSKASFSSRTS